MSSKRLIFASLTALALSVVVGGGGGVGCAAHRSDETPVRGWLAPFNRAGSKHDACGVRIAMASQTPAEKDLADAVGGDSVQRILGASSSSSSSSSSPSPSPSPSAAAAAAAAAGRQ